MGANGDECVPGNANLASPEMYYALYKKKIKQPQYKTVSCKITKPQYKLGRQLNVIVCDRW